MSFICDYIHIAGYFLLGVFLWVFSVISNQVENLLNDLVILRKNFRQAQFVFYAFCYFFVVSQIAPDLSSASEETWDLLRDVTALIMYTMIFFSSLKLMFVATNSSTMVKLKKKIDRPRYKYEVLFILSLLGYLFVHEDLDLKGQTLLNSVVYLVAIAFMFEEPNTNQA